MENKTVKTDKELIKEIIHAASALTKEQIHDYLNLFNTIITRIKAKDLTDKEFAEELARHPQEVVSAMMIIIPAFASLSDEGLETFRRLVDDPVV